MKTVVSFFKVPATRVAYVHELNFLRDVLSTTVSLSYSPRVSLEAALIMSDIISNRNTMKGYDKLFQKYLSVTKLPVQTIEPGPVFRVKINPYRWLLNKRTSDIIIVNVEYNSMITNERIDRDIKFMSNWYKSFVKNLIDEYKAAQKQIMHKIQ